MNKILDKLGIYDLIAILLSGISISTVTLLVAQFIYGIEFPEDLQINETLSFLVISYFVGLIFHEFSFVIQRLFTHGSNILLKKMLKTSEQSDMLLTPTEKDGIYHYVENKLHLDPLQDNDNIIYNYCKYVIIKNEKMDKADRNQSMSAMSRSLSLYFIFLFAGALISAIWKQNVRYGVLSAAAAFLAVLFFIRWLRFAKLRIVYIFRMFYYSEAANANT